MKTHKYTTRVYYDATDAGGVVYHAHYLHYIEHARMEFWLAHGIDSSLLAKNRQIVFVATNCDIKWQKPAFLGDVLTVHIKPVELQRVSVLFEHEIYKQMPTGQQLINSCQLRLVCVDNKTMRAITIPEDLREVLQYE